MPTDPFIGFSVEIVGGILSMTVIIPGMVRTGTFSKISLVISTFLISKVHTPGSSAVKLMMHAV